jgi:hypothetical protein
MATVLRSPSPLLPNVGMSQSGLMVAALIGGFIVFIAMQGKLATYWSILLGGGAATGSTSTTTTPSATTPSATTPSTSTTIPSSLGSLFGLGGTGASGGSGTVGYNAFTGAGSGLTPAGAALYGGG